MAIERTPGSSSPSPDESTLSGLLAVLERAPALPSAGRPRPRRAVLRAAAGARGHRLLPVARPVPQPRPRPVAPAAQTIGARVPGPAPVMWRTDRTAVRPAAVPLPPRRRPGLTRRLALWGSGTDGAHLAWNRSAPTAIPAAAALVADAAAPAGRPSLRGRLRQGVRRLALWGAGATGSHLAWNVPPQPRVYSLRLPARPAATDAVRLTELPSTPSIEPVASSPAAALLPAPSLRAAGVHIRASSRPPRPSQPRASESPVGWPAHPPAPAPEPCPALPAPSGWPSREAGPPAGTRSLGRARTRGDPPTCRVRGPTP